MKGSSLGRRSVLWPLLTIAAVLVIAVAASRATQSSQSTPAPGQVSAIAACQLPGTLEKAGGTLNFQWHLAVRLDSPQESALLFTSGSNRLLCEAQRGSDGTFWGSTTAVGGFEPEAGNALTYESGASSAPGATYPSIVALGQLPQGAASIDLVTSDGEAHGATIGNGWYLAWVATSGSSDKVVEVDARDSTGEILARLSDPSGLQAGTSAAPASKGATDGI